MEFQTDSGTSNVFTISPSSSVRVSRHFMRAPPSRHPSTRTDATGSPYREVAAVVLDHLLLRGSLWRSGLGFESRQLYSDQPMQERHYAVSSTEDIFLLLNTLVLPTVQM
jgi:hypothetical protein